MLDAGDMLASTNRSVVFPTTASRCATRALCIGTVAALVTGVVLRYAWISDDGFITARYAQNLLHGFGPVFNLGERVQGFTHPLWFLMLTTGMAVFEDPVWVVAAFGALLTLAMFTTIGAHLIQVAPGAVRGAALFVGLACVLATSEAWRSFQTSGLENGLCNLLLALMVVELFRKPEPRTLRLSTLASLLVLTRPDFALLVAPLVLLLLGYGWSRGETSRLALGAAPLVGWLVFSSYYYGELLPNTARAKLGIFGFVPAVKQGLYYVVDFMQFEPGSALAALFCFAAAVLLARRPGQRAMLIGLVLYLCYVILVGGDFMRGRFLQPVIVLSCLMGVSTLARLDYQARRSRTDRLVLRLAAGGAALAIAGNLVAPAQDALIRRGIVNERLYYPGFHVASYVRTGEIDSGSVRIVPAIQAFVCACGPVALHASAIGALGYRLGPQVTVIDTIGLTDRYVASLPKSALVGPQRVGHPTKLIPVAYLGKRGDIALFSDWRRAVRSRDCSIIGKARALAATGGMFDQRQPASVLPSYANVPEPSAAVRTPDGGP